MTSEQAYAAVRKLAVRADESFEYYIVSRGVASTTVYKWKNGSKNGINEPKQETLRKLGVVK